MVRAGAQDGSLGPTSGPRPGWALRSGEPSQMGWNPWRLLQIRRGLGGILAQEVTQIEDLS